MESSHRAGLEQEEAAAGAVVLNSSMGDNRTVPPSGAREIGGNQGGARGGHGVWEDRRDEIAHRAPRAQSGEKNAKAGEGRVFQRLRGLVAHSSLAHEQ